LPLYEYRCEQCGHSYEKIQKFDAEHEVVCPKCGGALFRPLTVPALQFKGAGWYVNDYAPKGAAPAGGEAKSGSEEKPAGGSESKPAGDSKPSSESKPAAAESSAKPTAAPSSSSTTT
jgi:putative FmdB family regulatory protein